MFLFGISPAQAVETPTTNNHVVLAENTRYSLETQKLILIGNADLLSDPTFNTLLTSYGTNPIELFSFLEGLSSHDQNTQPSIQIFETSHGTVQPGGTAGTGGTNGGQTVAAGGGVVTTTTNASATPVITTPTVASTPVTTATIPSATTIATPTLKTLRLTELYPNTTGNDATEEYVRLQNTGNEPMNVNGWMLKDASGKISKLSGLETLAPGATMQIFRSVTNLALNNDADTVYLIAPDEQVVDQVSYANPKEGDTYRSTQSGWQWPTSPAITAPVQPTSVVISLPQPVVSTVETVNDPQPIEVVIASVAPMTLQLVEVYPSTTEGDETAEYVVIKNTGTEPVLLNGWILKDASDKTYTLSQTESLAPGATWQLPRTETKLTLNNDEDTLSLFAPDKSLIDQLSYDNAPKGETFKRTENVWHWSSDVPSTEPTTVPQLSMDTTPAVTASTTSHANDPTLADILTQPDGTVVTITATVTALPSVLGKQFFYVQQKETGIQVYKNDAIFPDLTLGQHVRVVGELSTVGTERRLKVTKTGTIEPLSSVETLNAKTQSITDINALQVGSLIQVVAIVADVSSDTLKLEDNGNALDIGIGTYTKIETTAMKPGMKLQVSGIIRATSSGFKLMPRFQEDIVVLEQPATTPLGNTLETGKAQAIQQEQKTALLLAGGSAIVLVAWIIHQLITNKRTLYASHTLPFGPEKVH